MRNLISTYSLLLLCVAIITITYACGAKKDVNIPDFSENNSKGSKEISSEALHKHTIWDELTKKYVAESGFVDYKGLISEKEKLNEYLHMLSTNHPNETWSSNDRKAYWINAYNAFTIKLIVANYPVETIKDLGGRIYRVNTPWDIKFINIEGKEYHLNDLEHNILRKEWNDGRIHAAVNCASVSCPKLMQGAYIGSRLDDQLDTQMKDFIHDETKNDISNPKKIKLSKLFRWFSGDFKTDGQSVISFINQYTASPLPESAKIEYLDYDWGLNDRE